MKSNIIIGISSMILSLLTSVVLVLTFNANNIKIAVPFLFGFLFGIILYMVYYILIHKFLKVNNF